MDLFQYAVIKDEKRDKDGEIVEEAQLLVEPTHVLAKSDREVGIQAAKAIPDEHMKDLDRVRVIVHPF